METLLDKPKREKLNRSVKPKSEGNKKMAEKKIWDDEEYFKRLEQLPNPLSAEQKEKLSNDFQKAAQYFDSLGMLVFGYNQHDLIAYTQAKGDILLAAKYKAQGQSFINYKNTKWDQVFCLENGFPDTTVEAQDVAEPN